MGAAGGLLSACVCIVWSIRAVTRQSPRSLLAGSLEEKSAAEARRTRRTPLAIFFGLVSIAFLFSSLAGWISQVAGFFAAGTLFLVSMLLALSAWLRSSRRQLLR